AGILPGSGITTVNGTSCTIGSSCTVTTPIVYSTPSASTNASIGATTMVTVGASNATYRFSHYASVTVVGSGCTGASDTLAQISLTWTDPLAAGASTSPIVQGPIDLTTSASPGTFNGQVGPAGAYLNTSLGLQAERTPWIIRAKAGTVIQYQVTYQLGGGCVTGPSYQLFPILEQLTTN
ncbi:MAG TPA: hypothetical protein VNX46_18300, partial [Candidatus Acidoferrum sp.]|nr:hypothetical protein [Candidatus Acidoferrum sp.]